MLGPLLIEHEDVGITLPAGKQRALLAALLAQPNRVVSYDALADILWPADPPPSVRVTTRNYVRRLRDGLGPAVGARIVTRHPGYLIEIGEDEYDLLAFGRLCDRGQSAVRNEQWRAGFEVFDEALALWRGEPFCDVSSEALRDSQLSHLTELRLKALESRFEAGLRLGEDDDLIATLRRLTGEHPVRERFHAQLMLALYRTGRQGEALAAYQSARRALVDELGIEPGAELQRLHERILAGDTELAAAPAPSSKKPDALSDPKDAAAGAGPVVPRQLPASVRHFAGRADELKALSELAGPAARPAGSVVIATICGSAGIGKTALAVHWAHEHADRFPDGQLYVDLRGFDPTGAPLTVAAAVRRFLDALKVAPARIPADLDGQIDLYRTLLADRRMLVVLDNARDSEQARPLLPGAVGCLVLATSRDQLAGLVAVEGAVPLGLGLLPLDEARVLLANRLGLDRVAAWPEAVDELIELCARLPLALGIAAARAALRPAYPLSLLVEDLRDAGGRLSALDTGDVAASVRAVFWWSYRTLRPAAARMFRLLGLHPGPEISAAAAASLAGISGGEARRLLDELTAAHLLAEQVPGRYSFHDLLRAYAAEQADEQDAEDERRAALHRGFDHYLHSAHAARRLLYPGWRTIELAEYRGGVTPEGFADRDDALAWYDAECAVLRSVVAQAADTGFDTHTWQLSWALTSYLQLGAYSEDWVAISETALAATRRGGDLAGQAYAHRWLGDALMTRGSYDEAHSHLDQALAIYHGLGDSSREGNTHFAIARAFEQEDRVAEALEHAQRACDLYRAADYPAGQAQVLNAAGWYQILLGRYKEALDSCGQALALSRDTGDLYAEAATLDSIGFAHDRLGDYAGAVAHYRRALDLQQSAGGYFYLQTLTLTHLGDAHLAAGDPGAAREAWRQALSILDDLQHPDADKVRGKLSGLAGGGAGVRSA
ncbi:MAG TPA: BTAD domain-containing putative transcriptional regulator [Actinocrinis sp.]